MQKGSMPLSTLLSVGITIAVIIIVLTVSSLIVEDLQAVDEMTTSDSKSITAEANTSEVANNSLIVLAHDSADTNYEALVTTSLVIYNDTSGQTWGSANYTAYVNGSFWTHATPVDAGEWFINASDEIFFNYTYTDVGYTHAYNTSDEGLAALFELADWLPLLALVIAAGVIVGLVMFYMGGVTRRE